MNWFTSLPQWFQMLVIFLIVGPLAYRLIRYGFSIKIKAPGGAEGEIDADNIPSEKSKKKRHGK